MTSTLVLPPICDLDITDNPLLVAWQRANGQNATFTSWDRDYHRDAFEVRRHTVLRYSWAVPSPDALWTIAHYALGCGVIEVGAGLGYWAALLRSMGVDVIATDANAGRDNIYFAEGAAPFTDVVRADAAEAAAAHPDRVLLTVWPEYQGTWITDAIAAHYRAGGQRVIFVGEDRWGCTGDESTFDFLELHYREVAFKAIPQWSGIHDYLTVYERPIWALPSAQHSE